jgi:hypothetical protein
MIRNGKESSGAPSFLRRLILKMKDKYKKVAKMTEKNQKIAKMQLTSPQKRVIIYSV